MARTAITGLKVQIVANGKLCREFAVIDDDGTPGPQSDKC